jgi:hypothetical protein
MSSTSIPPPAQESVAKNSRVPSCVLCQTRKVRCDRKEPCTGCVKAGVSCVPSVPVSVRRRRRIIDGDQLTARLRRCEALLKAYEGNASQGNNKTSGNGTEPSLQSHLQSQTSGPEQLSRQPIVASEGGKMIIEHGQHRYVDKSVLCSFHWGQEKETCS